MERYGLPPGTAIRVELPAPDLRPLIAHYHAFDSDPAMWNGVENWALPTWPTIRFAITARRMAVDLGPRRYDPVPDAALYGTTSYARRVRTHGGVSVGIAVTPLGWSRLFGVPASRSRDRVVPLDTLLPGGAVAALADRLAALDDRLTGLAGLLDTFIAAHLRPPNAREPQIVALNALIAADETVDIATAAARIGISTAALRRLSVGYFGFPPKLLLVRHRFLRTFVDMLLSETQDFDAIDGAYFDQSHFLRDARRFLGTTPRRFAAADQGFLLARLRAYAALARASGQTAIYA